MKMVEVPPRRNFAQFLIDQPELLDRMGEADVSDFLRRINDRYLHWDRFRFQPKPADISYETLWAYLRLGRAANHRLLPLLDKSGKPFSYSLPDCVLKSLSQFDRSSGDLIGSEGTADLPSRERYVISSLMEEAISSSQLEGATTTRVVAKEMLRSGRKPRNPDEQMIVNNWLTIQHLREHRSMEITPEAILEIHAMITHDTLDDPDDTGRLRARDDIAVVTAEDDIIHQPPLASELRTRIEAFCAFANNSEPWIHPVIKAAILHFWIGYDHPFVDGNGRTARALFYWYLLSRGYWLFEYLSVSRYFNRAPVLYARSYLYSETDNNDLTYFVVYNLRVVQRALQDVHEYIARKQNEIREMDVRLHDDPELNLRQRALMAHALRHPRADYTITTHMNTHQIVYQTARTDLLDLVKRKLLVKHKNGKVFVFTPTPDLEKLLVPKRH